MEKSEVPLSVTLDIISKDIEEYLISAMSQAGIEADIVEFAVFKALSAIQKRKQYINSTSYLGLLQNDAKGENAISKKCEEVLKQFQSVNDNSEEKPKAAEQKGGE